MTEAPRGADDRMLLIPATRPLNSSSTEAPTPMMLPPRSDNPTQRQRVAAAPAAPRPIGFSVAVRALDLRPGGTLRYGMTAVDPRMVAFMDRGGMPRTTASTLTFTEVSPPRRLVYTHAAVVSEDASFVSHPHAWFPGVENMQPGMEMPHTYPGPYVPRLFTFPAAGMYGIRGEETPTPTRNRVPRAGHGGGPKHENGC